MNIYFRGEQAWLEVKKNKMNQKQKNTVPECSKTTRHPTFSHLTHTESMIAFFGAGQHLNICLGATDPHLGRWLLRGILKNKGLSQHGQKQDGNEHVGYSTKKVKQKTAPGRNVPSLTPAAGFYKKKPLCKNTFCCCCFSAWT